ncbi:hypothetical protein GUJ93_ZPchr0011g27221 [Zizania palustris]|uniref:Uncharacterized protein n=1 Tax=Zizania palustris TaxID=103762 RepID=A0A8J5WG81_ZIZPA|nr:hypothetical protein GUJ93_ZPchr0011g27221 [Zizania palustris]
MERFNASYPPSSTIMNDPLAHQLKHVHVAAKMMETTTTKYVEITRRVAALGVLHHFEDVSSVISPATEVEPITFRGKHLLAPSLGAATSLKVFQVPWKAIGQEATKAWMDEVHFQKKLRTHPPRTPSPSHPSADPKVWFLLGP